MGCTSSKQARRDQLLENSPLSRSQSLPRNLPQKINDSFQLVALSSTAVGPLNLNHTHLKIEHTPNKGVYGGAEDEKFGGLPGCDNEQQEVAVQVYRAKAWSGTMERRMTRITARTPTLTPSGEPESINAWELMEGLEDTSPFNTPTALGVDRSISFHTFSSDPSSMGVTTPRLPKTVPNSVPGSGTASPSPIGWVQMSPDGSIFSDFDKDIIASFRKALAELSPPNNHLHLHPSKPPKPPPPPSKPNQVEAPPSDQTQKSSGGIVKARVNEFQEQINRRRRSQSQSEMKVPAGGEEKVVLYLTSLRGVRKTFEDCSLVRTVLTSYGVKVDARDVSMHQQFKEELKEMAGELKLPRLFVKGRDVGGTEEVMRLHELGELEQLLGECEKVGTGTGCDACGDVRFVSCLSCYGSCKVYVGEEGGDVVFEKCSHCNENGIIRCPACCV